MSETTRAALITGLRAIASDMVLNENETNKTLVSRELIMKFKALAELSADELEAVDRHLVDS